MKGSTVCRMHGGSAPQVRAKAKRVQLRAEALTEASNLGASIELDHGEALIAMRDEAAANVVALRRIIQERGIAVGPDGIADETFHVSGRPTGEAKLHVLVVFYNEERDRLAKLDKLCLDAGLAERQMRLEEVQVALLVDSVVSTFRDLGLTPEQTAKGKKIMAAYLRGERSPRLAGITAGGPT